VVIATLVLVLVYLLRIRASAKFATDLLRCCATPRGD